MRKLMKPQPYRGTVLIVGGTGKTGRRVASRLAARDVRTRLVSRSGHPTFDWRDRSTWEGALRGTSAAYVTYSPDIALPGSADDIEEFANAAIKLDVQRIVLLSGRGEEEAEAAEERLQASRIDSTVIRSTWFSQNFSEGFLRDSILSGHVGLPADAVREPFVDVDDIADVAVAALTEEGHGGQLYELTGPRLLTFREAVAEIADVSGRPVRYEVVDNEEFVSGLRASSLPDEYVGLLDYLFGTVLDGRNESVTDGVHRAIGRGPRDFRQFAKRAARAGAWGAEAEHVA
jgi:uncharacterized protein YbjT (DUF2867 family)